MTWLTFLDMKYKRTFGVHMYRSVKEDVYKLAMETLGLSVNKELRYTGEEFRSYIGILWY